MQLCPLGTLDFVWLSQLLGWTSGAHQKYTSDEVLCTGEVGSMQIYRNQITDIDPYANQ